MFASDVKNEIPNEIPFDPSDLFPVVDSNARSYADAQAHSEKVDRWLGLRVEEIESELIEKRDEFRASGQELWIGLPVRSLMTPYTELRALVDHLKPSPGETLVDLGAAYGRMAFVIGEYFPLVNFIGLEFVCERVTEAKRILTFCKFDRVCVERADLSSPEFTPPAAEYYLIYDYGSRSSIEKTLQDLKAIARTRPITVIGRGRASRDIIERDHPWLSQVVAPEHLGNSSVYRSASAQIDKQ